MLHNITDIKHVATEHNI